MYCLYYDIVKKILQIFFFKMLAGLTKNLSTTIFIFSETNCIKQKCNFLQSIRFFILLCVICSTNNNEVGIQQNLTLCKRR